MSKRKREEEEEIESLEEEEEQRIEETSLRRRGVYQSLKDYRHGEKIGELYVCKLHGKKVTEKQWLKTHVKCEYIPKEVERRKKVQMIVEKTLGETQRYLLNKVTREERIRLKFQRIYNLKIKSDPLKGLSQASKQESTP